MEIEKKYLVRDLPRDLEDYPHETIEQAYICTDPTLRIRRKGRKYIFTFKNRVAGDARLNVSDEIESEISYDAYEHLYSKADGIPIKKTRYYLPYEGHTIELDVFHGEYDGFCLAEVEFESVEAGERFVPPIWFGEDVSGDVRYTNSYMALHGNEA